MNADARGGRLSPRAFMRNLALLLLLNVAVISGIAWLATPAAQRETVLNHTWDVLRGRSGDDSWDPAWYALNYLRSPHTAPLYEAIFFKRGVRYQYPPSALVAIAAMLAVAPERVLVDDERYAGPRPTINDMMGWVFLLLMFACTAALVEIGLRQSGVPPGGRGMLALRLILVAGFTLTFYPVVKAFTVGQIQTWVNGAFAAALLCWVTGRKAGGGVLIGLICLIKPHYGVLLLWAALRREWRFAVACGATVAAGLAASIAVFGWANHIDYLRVLSFLSEHGESYFPNQSINGLLNRLMSIADPQTYNNVVWREGHFPPFTPWIYASTLLSSILILGAALLRRRREHDPDRVLDFCTMVVSLTIASPIAWEHHYGVLLPIFAILYARAPQDRARIAWLAGAYVLIANFFPAANLLADTVFNPLQSHLLAGALLLLGLMHARPAGATAQAPAGAPVMFGDRATARAAGPA